MIEIKKGGERIKIYFPYNPDYIAKIKSIEGYRWHPDEKSWSIPYSKLERLLSLFDARNIVVDHSVWLDELKKELVTRKYSSKTR
jgi:hypothetical protein